jgi:hypothetical protein
MSLSTCKEGRSWCRPDNRCSTCLSDSLAREAPEKVIQVLVQDPLGWLHVSCKDYDAYSALPLLVIYHDRQYSRRGWDSDCMRAYYAPGTDTLAFEVKS